MVGAAGVPCIICNPHVSGSPSGTRARATPGAPVWRACGVQLQPQVDAVRAELLTQPALHADETPVAMLDPGPGSWSARLRSRRAGFANCCHIAGSRLKRLECAAVKMGSPPAHAMALAHNLNANILRKWVLEGDIARAAQPHAPHPSGTASTCTCTRLSAGRVPATAGH